MQLSVHPYTLTLRDPFRISHGSRTEQPTLIVRLTDPASGQYGLGEAPMTSYYGLDSQRCRQALEALRPALLQTDFFATSEVQNLTENAARLHAFLDAHAPELHPFLRCALDVAFQDLAAKKLGKRLNQCWKQDTPHRRIPTSYTIGLASIGEMRRKMLATPWPVYKIKLGTADRDLEIVRALRSVTTATFRVDANTGWTVEQTLAYAPELAELGVEFIEQPLPVAEVDGQRTLFQQCPLPVIADESCQTLEDVARCAGLFHGINVKVVKCGGLYPARQMISQARELGLKVMAGCMTESSVGISAIAQLVPELDYVDIDGALLLADDPAQGVTFTEDGLVVYPDRPGTGALLRS